MTPSVLILVPARGGSKRLPGKNIRPLNGRNLLVRFMEALQASDLRDAPCLLSTDDSLIQETGLAAGMMCPWLRPEILASDTASSLNVALHALDWWEETTGEDPDILMLMQPTSPFRNPSDIDAAYALLGSEMDVDAVIGCQTIHRSPKTLFRAGESGSLIPLMDADAPSDISTPNGALYAIRPLVLRTEQTFFPRRSRALAMDAIRSIDIDTDVDWLIAEAVASRLDLTD